MPLQHGDRLRVGFLQIDAPVFQFVQRYTRVGYRAPYEGSRRDHTKVAVEILQLRFAVAWRTGFIQHLKALRRFPSVSVITINRVECPPVKPTDL
jgi:hypothetical protein